MPLARWCGNVGSCSNPNPLADDSACNLRKLHPVRLELNSIEIPFFLRDYRDPEPQKSDTRHKRTLAVTAAEGEQLLSVEQPLQGCFVRDNQYRTANFYQALALETGEQPRNGFARRPDHLGNLLMRERKSGSNLALVLCWVTRQVQQKARQFFCRGSRKR